MFKTLNNFIFLGSDLGAEMGGSFFSQQTKQKVSESWNQNNNKLIETMRGKQLIEQTNGK